jgi:predicted lipoprotein with Yx(FWY)xxD motif
MSTHHRNVAVACALVAVTAVSVGSALAGTAKPIVKAKANATLGKTIVVDAKDRTLYRLSGETKSNLKCTTTMCLGFWPALTVPSKTTKLVAGSGVHGKLSLLHRPGGVLQVMLAGKPLYRFAADKAPGAALGNNLMSFGGTWNVLSAGTKPAPTTTSTPAAPPPVVPAY